MAVPGHDDKHQVNDKEMEDLEDDADEVMYEDNDIIEEDVSLEETGEVSDDDIEEVDWEEDQDDDDEEV